MSQLPSRRPQRVLSFLRLFLKSPRRLSQSRALLRHRRRSRKQETPHEVYLRVKRDLSLLVAGDNDRLVALGHSRPALEVRAPAFFRHVIFFFPHDPHEKNPLLYPGTFDREKAMIKLGALLQRLADQQGNAQIEADLRKYFKKDESYILDVGSYLGFDLRSVVDVYSEYATISLVLDNNSDLCGAGATHMSPATIVEFIQKQIAQRKSDLGEVEYRQRFEEDYSPGEAVFFGMWELLNSDKGTRISKSDIGAMVGDFRGFAICPITGRHSGSRHHPWRQPGDKTVVFDPRDDDAHPLDLIEYLRHERDFFLDCLGVDRNGLLKNDSGAACKRIESNIVLCQLLDGDAIYGSALGNPSAQRGRQIPIPGAPLPITYFAIHNGQSANQLGRLIRRLHLMGELRLAALLDAETIMKLGASIRRLSGLVSNLMHYGTRLSAVGRREFNEVLELYTAIGSKCHGGFLYRMARANYYYEALQNRIGDFRSHPIRGWQSYPGFINRHFDQRFRSMRCTGQRYIDVGTRIERLFALYGTAGSSVISGLALTVSSTALSYTVATLFYGTIVGRFGSSDAFATSVILFILILTAFYTVYRLARIVTVQRIAERMERHRGNRVLMAAITATILVLIVFGLVAFFKTDRVNHWIDLLLKVLGSLF